MCTHKSQLDEQLKTSKINYFSKDNILIFNVDVR